MTELGIQLPPSPKPPPGLVTPFAWVRVSGRRVLVSGHGALSDDGRPAGPFGKIPSMVPPDHAYESARAAAIAMLGNLQTTLGDLDRTSAWLMVQGMINADIGFAGSTTVINGFSDLILDVFGQEIGRHARTAVGMATLPLNYCVIVAAELEIRD
ncbi:RidA family protein [Nocardia crassostreae]|uniref:RidA family protein n=1 Tax=Nocardia crassostreae TaxID=53428 RepID=UPI001FDF386D|nr:RidA family protein [Nocardia crassostreae]